MSTQLHNQVFRLCGMQPCGMQRAAFTMFKWSERSKREKTGRAAVGRAALERHEAGHGVLPAGHVGRREQRRAQPRAEQAPPEGRARVVQELQQRPARAACEGFV